MNPPHHISRMAFLKTALLGLATVPVALRAAITDVPAPLNLFTHRFGPRGPLPAAPTPFHPHWVRLDWENQGDHPDEIYIISLNGRAWVGTWRNSRNVFLDKPDTTYDIAVSHRYGVPNRVIPHTVTRL